MKNDPVIGTLVGVLALSALVSVVFCFGYSANTRDFRALQGQVGQITSRRAAINQLVADALEYSKKNADIDPLLEAIGAKQSTKPAPANAAKPPAK